MIDLGNKIADGIVALVIANAGLFADVLGEHTTGGLKAEVARAGTNAFWHGTTGSLSVYAATTETLAAQPGSAHTRFVTEMNFDLIEPRNDRGARGLAEAAVLSLFADAGDGLLGQISHGGAIKGGSGWVDMPSFREDAGSAPGKVALIAEIAFECWHGVPVE